MTMPAFRPTHVVPRHGMPAWEEPDPSRPTADLDPLLPVQLTESRGDWGHVLCSNGWSAWVDGRRLLAVPEDPPAADAPPARTADPRPLLTRVEEALARYRTAADNLSEGGLDGEAFRQRTRGLRVGIVVDGDSAWLYDSAHGRWLYTDGAHLHTYAPDEPPQAVPDAAGTPAAPEAAAPRGAPAHPPTRVVSEDEDLGRRAAADGPGPAADPPRPQYTPTRVVPDAGEPPVRTPAQDGDGGGGPPAGRAVPDAEPTRLVSGPPDGTAPPGRGPAGADPDGGRAPARGTPAEPEPEPATDRGAAGQRAAAVGRAEAAGRSKAAGRAEEAAPAGPAAGRPTAPGPTEPPADRGADGQDGQDGQDGPGGPDGSAGHPPTRLVSGTPGPPPGPEEPTRVVSPGAVTSDEP